MCVTRRESKSGDEQERMKMSADSKWVGAESGGSKAKRCGEGKEKETIVIRKDIKMRRC